LYGRGIPIEGEDATGTSGDTAAAAAAAAADDDDDDEADDCAERVGDSGRRRPPNLDGRKSTPSSK
jgi:hypothetical protein